MFTANAETIREGTIALRIICAGFMASSVSVVVCGTLEGLGLGMASFSISLLRYAGIILPTAWLLSRFMGAAGVWHAFWITESAAAAVSALLIKHSLKNI